MSERNDPGDDSSEHRHGNEHETVAALLGQFIQMMQSGNIARLELEHGDLRVSLRSHARSQSSPEAHYTLARPAADYHAPDGAVASAGGHLITAPMIGTFYISSAPGEPAYIEIGDRVEEGQTIGIIEAMKIMNEIAADRAGTVRAVLAENGQTVEYGSPLVQLDPDG